MRLTNHVRRIRYTSKTPSRSLRIHCVFKHIHTMEAWIIVFSGYSRTRLFPFTAKRYISLYECVCCTSVCSFRRENRGTLEILQTHICNLTSRCPNVYIFSGYQFHRQADDFVLSSNQYHWSYCNNNIAISILILCSYIHVACYYREVGFKAHWLHLYYTSKYYIQY